MKPFVPTSLPMLGIAGRALRFGRSRPRGEPDDGQGGGGNVAMTAHLGVDPENASAALAPYLPKLVVDWLAAEPGATWRVVEGSMAFVDISGFTKLSERLARQGKVGGEELADTISACFTGLLAVAYAQGGGLLKFGGDALLLLFQGSG